MIKTLENPFYYLDNFEHALDWIGARYADLLTRDELAFIAAFAALPQPSRALLVRMVMRKGPLFRASRLRYDEIGCARAAAAPLAALGWIDERPPLTLEQVFGLLTKAEAEAAFQDCLPAAPRRKGELLDALRSRFAETRTFDGWHPSAGDTVYLLRAAPLCEWLRLLFFGNLHQDWTEFVLSELGIYRYEKVEFSESSRGFQTRDDVEMVLHLHRCGERLEQGEPTADILQEIPAAALDNVWLEGRRAKLLYRLAQAYERAADLPRALAIYAGCRHPGARIRAVRVHERLRQFDSALALARLAAQTPESEAETQHLARILPRLQRRLGLPATPAPAAPTVSCIDLCVPQPVAGHGVERLAARHLAQPGAPVHYVENALLTSLFGLLCWPAIFAAVPGAFFHPFHVGPADLHSADFRRRRAKLFDACLAQLDSGAYIGTINRNFIDKAGIQSPFVVWPVLSEELKDLALACIPAAHLKKSFERMLQDICANRAGLPDLIQFWPDE